jgi:energy-converting hydrogenase Eha subunit E
MAEHGHDNHGQTPANWTGAGLIMLAFLVGTIGVVISQPIVFWIGVALAVVGAVAWKVMLGMESSASEDVH